MFTTGQIKEIAQRLEAMGKKDSQFPLVTSLNGGETVAVVQNGENKRINLGDIFRPFQDYIVPPISDFDGRMAVCTHILLNTGGNVNKD